MSYKDKLEGIKTVKELFDFRDELSADHDKYSDLWISEKSGPFSSNLRNSQEAGFYLKRVERQIEYFENRGVFLNDLRIEKSETDA